VLIQDVTDDVKFPEPVLTVLIGLIVLMMVEKAPLLP